MNRKIVAIASLLTITTSSLGLPAAAQTEANSTPRNQISWVAPKSATMRLSLTNQFTATGERILKLELIVDGTVLDQVQAVSGKPSVQNFRLGRESRSGSREPLPQGVYQVGAVDRNGGLPYAMGDTFIPLTPLFATARSGIGIHRDSDRHIKGGPGTIGCLGVLTQDSINKVADFVHTYPVKTLTVDYGLTSGNVANRSK
jgi:lysozyme